MNHITDEELIAYSCGELTDDVNKQIEQHLVICEICHEQAYLVHELSDEWNQPTVEPTINLANLVVGIIKEGEQRRAYRKNRRITYFHFALAAAVTIFFSQFGIADYFISASENVMGLTTQTNQSIEKSVKFLNNFSLKLIDGGINK